MQIGLVGLQFSGKTTLFNTLSGNGPGASQSQKDEASIEVVKVPDERLNELTKIFNPKKQVNATIEVFDLPGLKMSDDNKVKITSTFLNGVRNNDALFYIQSRGINKREARLMLMFGFAHEVIQNIKIEPLRERMDNLVMQRLKGELSRCASCMVKCG